MEQISFRQLMIIVSAVFFSLSLFVFQDYGISWDEQRQRELAINNYDYVVNGEDGLENFRDKDYGIGFEMPLFLLERAVGLEDCQSIYQLRHLVSHWFFLFAAIVFAYLIHGMFDNKWLAVLAFLCLVLHPRIYVHSFVNSKDIPFLGGIILFLAQLRRYMISPNWKQLVWLIVASVFVINLRIMGVVVLLPVLIYMLFSGNGHNRVKHVAIFICGVLLTLLATWPYLWSDPISNFSASLGNMGDFRWDGSVFFLGETYAATDKPWFYSLVWFIISTPILFLIFGGIGLFDRAYALLKSKDNLFDINQYLNITGIYLLFGTLLGTVVFGSDNFDDWRHLYYIYPCFIILVIAGLRLIWDNFPKALLIVPIYMAWLVFNLIKLHPHQQVYFNELVPKSEHYIRDNFDMDYWGLSYKQGYEHILKTDNSQTIRVFVDNWPGELNLCSLTQKERKRIQLTDSALEADYFITNHRFQQGKQYFFEEIYTIKVQGSTILSVFKIQK